MSGCVCACARASACDYHDPDWPGQVRALTEGHGAVADGGRLATITSDPPGRQRGIMVSSICVASLYRLADAAQALAQATGGHAAGAIILTP